MEDETIARRRAESERRKARYEKYCRNLGRFIDRYAMAESILLALLETEAGVSEQVALCVFSGVRVDNAKSFINRLREVKGLPEDKLLSRAFAQFTVLNTARNDIVHNGAIVKPDVIEILNPAHIPERVRKLTISDVTFDEMESDLNTIMAAILLYQYNNNDAYFRNPDVLDPEGAGNLERDASAPWRYTPPQQAPSSRRTPRKRPKQSPPLDASRG